MLRLCASFLAVGLLVSSSALAGTPLPQFQWAVQPLFPTGQSSAHGMAVDFAGNTFVCGTFTDTLTFTTGTLQATGGNAPGNPDAYLVKYSTSGVALWARNGGQNTQNTNDVGYAVAVDAAGNSYMTGEYLGSGPTSFGGIQIDDTGGGAFLVKYASDGTQQWAKSLSEAGPGNSIAVSGSVAYVFVGGFPTASVFKVNTSDGSVADTWNFDNFLPDQIQKVSVDGSGNVIISGSFMGTSDFDPGAGTSNQTADGFTDGFVAKYTSTGGLTWVRKLTSSGADAVKNHALSASGEVYLSGSLEAAGTIDVAAAGAGEVVGLLDAGGNGQWLRNTTSDLFGSPIDLYADGIGADENGSYYIYGTGLPNGGTIGSYTIPAVNHFHVVRYTSAGAVSYAKFVTSNSVVLPRAILVVDVDIYNVVGGMVGETTFDSFTLADINGFPRQASFTAQVGDITSPVLASLATAEAAPDRVRITWYVTGLDGAASVERQRGDEGWEVVGDVARNGADYVSYDDRDVTPGDRLMYRLLWHEGGEVLRSEPVTVVVPRRIEALSLAVGPNPANAAVDALISVPTAGEARLALHDLQGRQVMERRVEAGVAGRLTVRLGMSDLPAGLYWLTLRHGSETARARVSVVR